MKNSGTRLFLTAFAATTVSLVAGIKLGLVEKLAYAIERGQLRASRDALPSDDRQAELNWTNRLVAKTVRPAVVSIEAEAQTFLLGDAQSSDVESHSSIPEESTRPRQRSVTSFSEIPENAEPNETDLDYEPSSGLGSGFIFDADHGYVLTNAHVVDGMKHVRVGLEDGRRVLGKILGTDPTTDLAVVQIEASGLQEIPFGPIGTTQVGDAVFAVGNPFGLEGSVTKGIISAIRIGEVAINGTIYDSLLQTDAVITPGSSGGPLVNLRGEVIGVSTAMATHLGEYEGVGFAIPVARVRDLVEDLISGGPGFLGVWVGPVDDPTSSQEFELLGWSKPFGVVVDKVIPSTGAEEAGLKANDILYALNGVRIDTVAKLGDILQRIAPGTRVDVGVWRDKRETQIPVRISRRFAPR